MSTELKTLNGYGFDATKLGGLDAQYYAQGRAAHNWLDNSWFVNPVNQRGATSYTGSVYTIDRWELSANTLNVGSDGITLVAGDSSSAVLTQYISGLRYGTYTQALNVNGTICTRIIQLSGSTITTIDGSNASYTGGYVSCVVSSSGYFSFLIRANAGYSITVRWAALYEGSYTASTLPAYQPNRYSAELAECQRYYRRFINSAPAMSTTATAIEAEMPLEPPMRVVPTITINSVGPAYTPEGKKSVSSSYSVTNTVNKAGYVFYTENIGIGLSCVITGIDGYLSADL